MSEPLPAALRNVTGYLLRRTYLRALQCAQAEIHEGRHPRDFAIITALEAGGPTSQRELAVRLSLNRTMVGRLVDSLVKAGWIERRRDPRDRRSYALTPTRKGLEALERGQAGMNRAEARLTEHLSAAEQRRLNALLSRLLGPEELALAPKLSSRTGFLVARAHHRMRQAGDELMAPIGIEPRHFGALTALGQGTDSQQELAEALGVSAPVVVEMVDDLERRGLVERRRNPADRRSYGLRMTPAGERALERARAALAEMNGRLDGSLGADGHRELRALLRKLLGAE